MGLAVRVAFIGKIHRIFCVYKSQTSPSARLPILCSAPLRSAPTTIRHPPSKLRHWTSDIRLQKVRSQTHSASAPGIEVINFGNQNINYSQMLASYSPNPRSQQVRRISALRDRFRASWQQGGVQPHPHNPRKQRKNPAAAGSGERFREGKWRRKRDSN